MASYKDNDPKGWCGDASRGAAMGRITLQGELEESKHLQVIRKDLDEGGYDENGTYFGIGDPIYWVSSSDGAIDYVIRAKNLDHAHDMVLRTYPQAIIGGDKYDISLDEKTLMAFLAMESESLGEKVPELNEAVRIAAKEYERLVLQVLEEWVFSNLNQIDMEENAFRSVEEVVREMSHLSGGAGYLYCMEADGAGIGTWDGNWDHLFKDKKAIKELSAKVKRETYELYNKFHMALVDCVLNVFFTKEE